MSLRTGIVTHEIYLAHDAGSGHPERPDRLRAVQKLLDAGPREGLVPIDPREATDEEIARVHAEDHIGRVASTAGKGPFAFDPDTRVSARSHEAARRAAGGALALVEAVMRGDVDNGFGFVRPPGHHAEYDRAMGFCLFNNVAIAAAALRQRHGLERILVVDWDVHHGNGTQHAFYRDPNVLFLSSHQYPFYPGTGSLREVGAGEGEGLTINLPFPAGYGDREYVESYLEVVEPVARAFRPEFVLISAGFDAHCRDPLAQMEVTEEGYRGLARIVLRVAEELCRNRVVALLEGGYDLTALYRSIDVVLDEMTGKHLKDPVSPPAGGAKPDVVKIAEVARHYWGI